MKRPRLGQKISAPDRMYRCTKTYKNEKFWVREEEALLSPNPVFGVFTGYRTASNGEVEYVDNLPVWVPKEFFECWLVVQHPRKDPIRIFPEDAEFAKGL